MSRICWSVHDDGQDWGRVGDLDLFWVETFGDKVDDWNNILHTRLPVDLGEDTLFETREDAFKRAEEVLSGFLKSIGIIEE